jgi:Pyruvate/2-oxoacid:ferredoxin oxidoreductase delta subunit
MGEVKKIPEIDYEYCKGCSICANECPVKCIEMKRIEES